MSDTPEPKACCQDDENLEAQPQDRPDVLVRVCAVCGCRHIEVDVDPVQLGVKAF